MISKNLAKALNKQYNLELASGYAYLAMEAYFARESYDGFKHFMKKQAEEEYEHAVKFFDFMTETGHDITLEAIEQPKNNFKSIEEVFKAALKHEEAVTASIHKLYETALKEKSYETVEFLNWFVKEQVEEEDNMNSVLTKLARIGDDETSLYYLDHEMGKR